MTLSQGLYTQDNVTLDLDKMTFTGYSDTLEQAYWKVRMEIDGDHTRMVNVCFEFSLIRVRIRGDKT